MFLFQRNLEEQARLVPGVVSRLNHTLAVFDWVEPWRQELRNLSDIIRDVISIYVNSSTTGDKELITQLLYISDYLLVKDYYG